MVKTGTLWHRGMYVCAHAEKSSVASLASGFDRIVISQREHILVCVHLKFNLSIIIYCSTMILNNFFRSTQFDKSQKLIERFGLRACGLGRKTGKNFMDDLLIYPDN